MPSPGDHLAVKNTVRRFLHTEKHVPLPLGGYGLPVVIRRKFSFAPQLSNISTLSLLPDFNSIQYDHLDANVEIGKEPSARATNHPLRIKYSLIRPSEPLAEEQPRSPTPALRRKPGRVGRITPSISLEEIQECEDSDDSTEFSNTLGDASNLTDPTSGTSSSRNATAPSDQTPYDHCASGFSLTQHGNDCTVSGTGEAYVSVRDQIAWDLGRCVPQILKMFYIVDLQFIGHPISVASKDLVPRYSLCPDEAHFFNEEYIDQPWQIQVSSYFGQEKISIVLQGDLYPVSTFQNGATHRFIAAVDLTEFVESVRSSEDDIWVSRAQSPDIWLNLALEEMRINGLNIEDPPIRYTSHRKRNMSNKKKWLDLAMDLIKDIYQDYFILGLSDTTEGVYEITHVSQSIVDLDEQTKKPPDLTPLAAGLAHGRCFSSEIVWGETGRVYCIPMFGPELNCWLCFIVDGSLPLLWEVLW